MGIFDCPHKGEWGYDPMLDFNNDGKVDWGEMATGQMMYEQYLKDIGESDDDDDDDDSCDSWSMW